MTTELRQKLSEILYGVVYESMSMPDNASPGDFNDNETIAQIDAAYRNAGYYLIKPDDTHFSVSREDKSLSLITGQEFYERFMVETLGEPAEWDRIFAAARKAAGISE